MKTTVDLQQRPTNYICLNITKQFPQTNRYKQIRPQVPRSSGVCADIDGRHVIRGAKNLGVRSYRQTISASNIKDSEMLNVLTYNGALHTNHINLLYHPQLM